MKTVVLILALGAASAAPKWRDLNAEYSFEQYVADFAKPWVPGSAAWKTP